MTLTVDIRKKLNHFELDVAFETGQEIFSVLGESGCGKSMTLKCIAGIETPDSGRIVLNGKTLFDAEKKINLKPQERGVGYLFQDYALFPNMTVSENIGIGVPKKQRRKITEEYLSRFYLEEVKDSYPQYLSGGQKQRTALARMLAAEPEILLLDEPFAAVDSYLSWKLERQLMELADDYGKPMLFVSHDRDEVYRLSDRIGIIHRGQMQTVGTKHEIFRNPETKAAAILTGCKNLSPVERMEDGRIHCSGWGFEVPAKALCPTDEVDTVGIRAHDIELWRDLESAEQKLACRGESAADGYLAEMDICQVIETPFDTIYVLKCPGTGAELRAEISKKEHTVFEKNQKAAVFLPYEKWLRLRSR